MRRKWIFVTILLAVCVGLAMAGEGDRRYDNFYAEEAIPGAQETITLPWTAWRYTLYVNAGAALADSVRVTFTFSDSDTELVRFRGGLTCSAPAVIPFYGPPITAARIKCYGTNSHVTLLAWK